jgi:hypothetical protein
MGSDGSLSSAPTSPALPEPELPILPSSSRQSMSSIRSSIKSTHTPRDKMPKTNAYVFTAGLFKRTLLDTSPASILYTCLQPECTFATSTVSTKILSTSNLLKHYYARHRDIPTSQQDAKVQSLKTTATTIDKLGFFRKYPGGFNQDKSRKLTLNLIVSNNLQLRLVKSVLFRAWVKYHNPYVFI